jgi:PAS domain S-box-containing protein
MPRLDTSVLTRPERLAALKRVRLLMSASSAPVNGLVALAARAVVAPVGLMTLVDADHLHIVGSHGLKPPLAGLRDAPLTYTFCQFVLSEDEPLVVRDARRDPALHELYAVRKLDTVAYIGHPVHDATGEPVGALCVVDSVPRRWTADDVTAVGEAAHLLQVMLDAESASQEVVLNAAVSDAMLESALEAFIAIELDGQITRWNRSAERTFGWSAAEAVGRHVDDLIIPDRFRAAHREALVRLASGGDQRLSGQRLQLWALHRDGREFPIELTLNVVARPGGRFAHAFLYDITERVTAERELARERQFLQALLDSLDVGVVACDEQGRLALFNQTMLGILGQGPDWSTGETWAERYHVHDVKGVPLAAAEVPLTRAFRGEHVRDAELEIQTPGQRHRIFLANGQPIRDADGARLGAVVALHEVTDRRRAQRFVECELAVSRVLEDATTIEAAGLGVLQAVVTTLRWPHGELWLVDPVGKVLRNAAFWTDPRYELTDFLPGPLTPGTGISGRAWQTGQPVWVPDISIEPDQLRRHALAVQGLKVALAVPIRGGAGITGTLTFFGAAAEPPEESLIALLSGIAAHVGQYLERRRGEELAQALVRTKDEFIALVGHELRTPLTAISAYTELLLGGDTELAARREEFLGVIARNAETLRAIIDDLLDLAGLESGYVTMNERELDLSALVREVAEDGRPAAEAKGLTFLVEVPAAEVPVTGDPPRLRQVVEHLVRNAVTYTPSGGRVALRLAVAEDGVHLTVSDTGLGIPPDERERLFSRFFRASNVRSEGIPGTGLGLAISRTVVERHGGTIKLEDNGDQPGSTFLVRLPAVSP